MNDTPTEHQEAITLVHYMRARNIKFHHSPNETWTKSWKQKTKNKSEGVSAGFPDYLLIIPPNPKCKGGLLFIELKRQKGNNATQAQQEWLEELQKIDGVEAQVCKGAAKAIELIEKFI